MQMTISPGKLSGKVIVPTSKSIGHRIMICRYLASGKISAQGLTPSKDIKATGCALEGLKNGNCPCDESGSTLRFMVPIALALGGSYTFSGKGRLMQRPMEQYRNVLVPKGIKWEQGEQLRVSGKLTSGVYTLSGNVSSQYVTGLLLALPLLEGDSEIILSSPLQSASYVDITLEVQKSFGVICQKTDRGFFIKGGQKYIYSDIIPEADFSQAAFWLVANKLGSNIAFDLPKTSVQGDSVIVKILEQGIIDIDITDCPDLAPVLSVWLTTVGGSLINCERLKYKESDRLTAIRAMLDSLGGQCEIKDDTLIIKRSTLSGGCVDSFNDHRIAMAGAIAATVAMGNVTVLHSECVDKSYPEFWNHYISLGGNARECNDGE